MLAKRRGIAHFKFLGGGLSKDGAVDFFRVGGGGGGGGVGA